MMIAPKIMLFICAKGDLENSYISFMRNKEIISAGTSQHLFYRSTLKILLANRIPLNKYVKNYGVHNKRLTIQNSIYWFLSANCPLSEVNTPASAIYKAQDITHLVLGQLCSLVSSGSSFLSLNFTVSPVHWQIHFQTEQCWHLCRIWYVEIFSIFFNIFWNYLPEVILQVSD